MSAFFWLVVAALVVFIIATGYALFAGRDVEKLLPIGVALLAVFISVVSAFRAELLPLDLVVTGDLILANSEAGGANVAMTLGFLNKGYGEGIVEWVSLRVTRADGREWKKRSVAELNLTKLLEGVVKEGIRQYKFHGTNLGIFTAFPLLSKSAVSKALLFLRMEDILAGKHTFEVSVKLVSMPLKVVLTRETTLNQKIVDTLRQPGQVTPILFGEP